MNDKIKMTYRLEMDSPDELRPKYADIPGLRVEWMETRCPEFNKFLHMTVGYNHRWGGRTDWSQEYWYNHVNRDEMETWVAYMQGTPAGYFELEKIPTGEVNILSFGLLPQFIGKGIGGHVLTKAIERAWDMGASKVQVGTCSHDHPHALKNYEARGFHIQRTNQGPANTPVKSFWELIQERTDR